MKYVLFKDILIFEFWLYNSKEDKDFVLIEICSLDAFLIDSFCGPKKMDWFILIQINTVDFGF